MSWFTADGVAAAVLAVAIGIGLGLGVDESQRSKLGAAIAIVSISVLLFIHLSAIVWVTPILVIATGVTVLFSRLHRYSDSPLIADSPYWQRFMLVLMHEGKVRGSVEKDRS